MPNEATEKIRNNCWRQGSVFPVESHKQLSSIFGATIADDNICVVTTQSCCVLNEDLVLDPTIDVLVASPISKPDGNYLGAKSLRRLHFEARINKRAVAFETSPKDRYKLEKITLSSFAPDSARIINEDQLRTLITWVVARYEREAFPDAFEKRLRIVNEGLKKAASKLHDVAEIFIALNSYDELPDPQAYRMSLVFVMPDHLHQASEKRRKVETAINEIRGVLKQCKGIELDSAELRSNAEVSLRDLEVLRHWGSFDYLSYREQDKHVIK